MGGLVGMESMGRGKGDKKSAREGKEGESSSTKAERTRIEAGSSR